MSAGQGIGAIGGAIIGFFTGGPAGAVKGAYWGYMAGSVIDPPPGPHTEGPRLNDRVIQTSEEGAPLPTVFGTVRIAGNVIWSSGLEEIATTEEQGGGSGGGGTTSTTYSYKTDAAIALCSGEITGVRRIWADAKLIYDVGDATATGAILVSLELSNSVRVYTGSESQTADPLIQAIEGAANVPAFRGIAYIVFEDLNLANFGNRLPNFSFEIVKQGSVIKPAGTKVNYAVQSLPLAAEFDPVTQSIWVANYSSNSVSKVNIFSGTRFDYTVGTAPTGIVFDPVTQSIWVANTNTTYISKVNIFTGIRIDCTVGTNPYSVAFDPETESVWATNYASNNISKVDIHSGTKTNYSVGSYPRGVAFDSVTESVWVANSGSNTVSKVDIQIGARVDYAVGSAPWGCCFDPVTESVWVPNSGSNTISKVDIHSGTKVDYAVLSDPRNCCFDSITQSVWVANYSSNSVSKVDIHTGTRVDYAVGDSPYSVAFDPVTQSVWAPNSANNNISQLNIKDIGITNGGTALDDICEHVAGQSGLIAAEYDMSALAADNVRGYVISRPMSGRAALEPLQTAYHFDLAEYDGKIRAIKRGGSVVETIPEDALGAAETPDGVKVKLTRHNESELPSEIQISYSDIDNDHQAGTQYARSLTAQTANIQQISLPLGMTSQEAAQLAEVILNSARYTGRHTLEFALSYEYARLTPSDVVSLPAYGVQWSARIGQIDMGMPGLVKCQASPEVAALYTSILAGADATGIGQSLGLTGTTTLSLLDCALLRDDDNSLGWYVALSGSVDTWPGGALYKSNDAGATWTYAASAARLQAARIGTATNALANADCRVWDKTNTISVQMQADATLSSTTEANLLAGANSALLGASGRWELIQFLTATLETDGSYTLRDLLRGRKGTEHAAASHAIGDTFILLETASLQNLIAASAELNAARDYKALTLGQALESVSSVSHTYTGERLRCLAPVELGGGRDSSGNITLTWKRRDRINAGWNDYADIPMSESSEAYEVEIYDSSYATLKRTITGLATATASYTSAQQVTDFGGNQATVYARVYQLSATTGRGHYLQGSI